eukprot:COSAG01_NODE_864_length_13055_cov_18.442498_10_plen_97_part_00
MHAFHSGGDVLVSPASGSLTLPLRAYQVKKFRVAKNQPELEQCFRNESYLMQQLQHENLVRCYAVCDKRSDGSDAVLLALVLELMVRSAGMRGCLL